MHGDLKEALQFHRERRHRSISEPRIRELLENQMLKPVKPYNEGGLRPRQLFHLWQPLLWRARPQWRASSFRRGAPHQPTNKISRAKVSKLLGFSRTPLLVQWSKWEPLECLQEIMERLDTIAVSLININGGD